MLSNATAYATLPKSGAFAPFLRVIPVAGTLTLAGALDREIGTIKERQLASGMGSSNQAPVVLPTAQGITKMIANGAMTIFSRVYGAAGGKVSSTANGNFIGYNMTATTADGDDVDVLRVADAGGNTKTVLARGASITNTVTETAFDAQQQYDAGGLKAGDRIVFRGKATCTATNGTDTFTMRARLGATVLAGTLIANTGALDVANNDVALIDGEITIRTTGVGGTLVASGYISIGTPGTAAPKIFDLGSTVIDTTIAQLLGFTGQWSVANAGNIAFLDEFSAELHRA